LNDRDNKNDPLTLETMRWLLNVIAVMDENEVRTIVMNVSLRIQSYLKKIRFVKKRRFFIYFSYNWSGKIKVRLAAFTLFDKMTSIYEENSHETFVEQIFLSFITVTLHLNDLVQSVHESCKTCFQFIVPLLDQPKLIELVF
jgi:hypothetical protein